MTDSIACPSCESTAPQEELVPYARMFRNSQLVASRSGDQAMRRHGGGQQYVCAGVPVPEGVIPRRTVLDGVPTEQKTPPAALRGPVTWAPTAGSGTALGLR
jgi:hypothetical protein